MAIPLVHGEALPRGKAPLAATSTLLTLRCVAFPYGLLLALTMSVFHTDTSDHLQYSCSVIKMSTS